MEYNKKEIWILCLLWGSFVIFPILLSSFGMDFKLLLSQAWCMYVILLLITIFYILYPDCVRELLKKACIKQVDNLIGLSSENLNYVEVNKLRNDLKNEKLIKPTAQVITDDHKKIIKKISKLKELYDSFQNEQYEKVILDTMNHIKEISDEKKKVPYAVLAEMSYSMIEDKDYNKEDRISILKIIINHERVVIPEIYVQSLLSLASLYMETGNCDDILKLTYKAIYVSKSKKLDSSILSYAYYLQIFVFLYQKKLSRALSAAKEGLKYSSKNKEALFYYIESIIYFDFYNNTEMAEHYAKLSWSKLTSSDSFNNLLVQIYYFSLFFNHKYEEACEFLSNYCEVNKNSTQIGNLPYLLLKCNRLNEAEKLAMDYKKEHKDEKLYSINNVLAMIAMHKHNYEKAIYLFTEILPSFENGDTNYEKYFYSEILYNRGVCYLKLDNYEKAKIDIDKAMDLDFDNADNEILEQLFNFSIANDKKSESKDSSNVK